MNTYPATPRACPICKPVPLVPRPRNVLLWCFNCGAYHTNESRLCDISAVELAAFLTHYVPAAQPAVTA
jgi:hypothetical protein